jgi:hypothetical protein
MVIQGRSANWSATIPTFRRVNLILEVRTIAEDVLDHLLDLRVRSIIARDDIVCSSCHGDSLLESGCDRNSIVLGYK